MIFQTANHWCNLVETGQTADKQHSFPGETKLKWNKIKPDENNAVWLVVFPCSATSQKTTPCPIQPVSCIAHNAVQLFNYPDATHLEQEGANFKLIYIWGLLWRGNFCSRKTEQGDLHEKVVKCFFRAEGLLLRSQCKRNSSFTTLEINSSRRPQHPSACHPQQPLTPAVGAWPPPSLPLRQGAALMQSDQQMLSPGQSRTEGEAAPVRAGRLSSNPAPCDKSGYRAASVLKSPLLPSQSTAQQEETAATKPEGNSRQTQKQLWNFSEELLSVGRGKPSLPSDFQPTHPPDRGKA